MPANLPPDYFAAEKRFREASSTDEKIAILEEMISILPKHKGTDRLFGDLKRRMAKLKESKEIQRKSGKKEHWQVEKEGAGQVVLIGPPNSGKSALLRVLTNAQPLVADYPFTTTHPTPGMMRFEDVQIQLIELPAVTRDVMETWIPNAVFMADCVAIVADLSAPALTDDVSAVFHQIEIRRVKLAGDLPADPQEGYRYRRTIIIGNKIDIPGAQENLGLFKEWLEAREGGRTIPIIAVSATNAETCRIVPGRVFGAMKLIRVYPKRPGKKLVKEDPLVLPMGATVLTAAEALHKDIAAKLKFARGWGEGIYEGQQLARDFVLKDGFVLEFH